MGKKPHKPGENEIRCSVPFRIYIIKRVVEAKQNQELWERSHINQENPCKLSKSISIKSDVPLRFEFVLSKLWKPNKTRSCGKEATQTRRIHADCSYTNVRMNPMFRSASDLYQASCGSQTKPGAVRKKPCIQNQERIELRMKSDAPLRFRFALSELWKPNKTSCGKEADLY